MHRSTSESAEGEDDESKEKSFSSFERAYSGPVAFYTHLQERNRNNPVFLRRCLQYLRRPQPKDPLPSHLTLKLGLQRLLDYTPALAALNKIESVRAAACAQVGFQAHTVLRLFHA